MASLFVLVQIIAIVISPIYARAESEAFGGGEETIENPLFSLIYLGVILLVTGIILFFARKRLEKFIKIFILVAVFMVVVYLLFPLIGAIMYPSEEGSWGEVEIGSEVLVITSNDVDTDGVMEIVTGCSDRIVRIYESRDHTLEWESLEFDSNITQILIGNLDGDSSSEMAVMTDIITIFNEDNFTDNRTLTPSHVKTMAIEDLNDNDTSELIIGTGDARVLIFEFMEQSAEVNVSYYLDEIVYIGASDDGRIVAANDTKIIVLDSTTYNVELEITELEEITALKVFNDPEGEDFIIVGDRNIPYIYNLITEEHLRKGTGFENIKAIYIESYSIPGANDSIPDVIAVTERTIYIYPDLLQKKAWWLEVNFDLNIVLSTDLEGDGEKELILGKDDGYIYNTIGFSEGPDYSLPFLLSIMIALCLALVLHKHPEWYIVDIVGLIMAVGATVILGVTFAILPALVLLILLAIYDAISVYKTKHMIDLADSVIDMNLPVLLVIPKKLSYSFREKKPRLKEQLKEGVERDAMFMGLGDIVIPSLLVISSLSFLDSIDTGLALPGNVIVALGTMIGILIGFSILMRYVLKGNPQAGLPLLNSGAIIGFVVTYLLVFQDLSFGINWDFF